MKFSHRNRIITALMTAKKDGMTAGKLLSVLDTKKKDRKRVLGVLDALCRDNIVSITKDKYYLKGFKKYFEGTVVRVSYSSGFIHNETTDEDCFVRGRDLLGAVPGDRVIARMLDKKSCDGPSDNAQVIMITEENENTMTGIIINDGGTLKLRPDSFASSPLTISNWNGNKLTPGDKVKYKISKRCEHHDDHVVDIIGIYGSSEIARVSVDAYIDENRILNSFPNEVIDEARTNENKGISGKEIDKRLDLRHLPIFTIDGADTKDIDDAISIEKNDSGYKLGVHIADVSYYVTKNSAIDKEAYARGTSVYIADLVIPMIPKHLSNGICSLNPKVDRLAFSCLMDISKTGEITDFKFAKTVIKSRVQGVYNEINSIIDGNEDDNIKAKYNEVIDCIKPMLELSNIFSENRKKRGAPEITSIESKIICDNNGVCTDIKKRTSGIAEGIIEEFMLAANNCAAKLAMKCEIPFVYRIHEPPAAEKLLQLQETLVLLGIDNIGINEKSAAADIAAVLEKAKDNPREQVINQLVLRTMMKAKYSDEPLGHFGLVMKEYAHFTSPIRRYADLSIHRILSDFISKENKDKLEKKYRKFSHESAIQASNTELVAVKAERDCAKFYMAEYMKNHVGEEFDGVISGVINNGFFVELENTVEGKIDTMSLPTGVYEVENNISLVEQVSKKAYTIGDKVRIKVAAANVGTGLIDFTLIEENNK